MDTHQALNRAALSSFHKFLAQSPLVRDPWTEKGRWSILRGVGHVDQLRLPVQGLLVDGADPAFRGTHLQPPYVWCLPGLYCFRLHFCSHSNHMMCLNVRPRLETQSTLSHSVLSFCLGWNYADGLNCACLSRAS
jgi:hypothetical protein